MALPHTAQMMGLVFLKNIDDLQSEQRTEPGTWNREPRALRAHPYRSMHVPASIVRILAPFFGGSMTIFGSTLVEGRRIGIVHNVADSRGRW